MFHPVLRHLYMYTTTALLTLVVGLLGTELRVVDWRKLTIMLAIEVLRRIGD